jgi:hypothetical protein
MRIEKLAGFGLIAIDNAYNRDYQKRRRFIFL